MQTKIRSVKRIIPFVFIILFPLMAAGQTVRQLIEQDPHRALGNMYPYHRLDSVYTDAPKGYELFYVSHLGRHGSRFPSRVRTRTAVHKRYRDLAEKGMLSDEGKRFLDDLIAIDSVASKSYGMLSTLGQKELAGIGERMFCNAAGIFSGDAKVETYSTSSTRVMRSRDCLVSGLKKYNPDLQVSYAVSNRTGRTEQEVRGYYISEEEIQTAKNRKAVKEIYRQSWKDSELAAFKRRMFKFAPDTLDMRTVVYNFYFSGQACLACDSNLPDITGRMTTDELYNAWLRNNLSWYGNSCLWDGGIHTRTYRIGGGIVQCIIEDADAVIAGRKDVSATLRFSHDTYLLPVISFMNLHGVNFPTLQEAAENFRNWENVCLGTNVQLFFYRNRAGKVLVKILKNEKETTVDSIKPAAKGVYYRWDDLKKFWQSRMKLTTNDQKIVGVGGLSEAK